MERAIGVCREQGYAAVILVGNLDYYERYGFKPEGLDAPGVIEAVARRRGCLLKGRGGAPDFERASLIFLQDYRDGALGRISLETPESRALLELLRLPTATSSSSAPGSPASTTPCVSPTSATSRSSRSARRRIRRRIGPRAASPR